MEKIVVIDFGGQYAHLIASSVRKLEVACELWQPETPIEKFLEPDVKGVILSGGPASVYDPDAPRFEAESFFEKIQVPVLGICFGHQLIAQTFAKPYFPAVEKQPGKGEYGPAELEIIAPNGILKGLKEKEAVWMSHEDSVSRLPPNFVFLAATANSQYAAIKHIDRPIFGAQFHLEVTHTSCGMKIFKNFLEICQAKKEWTSEAIYKEARQILIEGVGDKIAIIFVSGGVDSSVLLELAKQNLPAVSSPNLPKEKIIAIYVDTGLGETNEAETTRKNLTGLGLLESLATGKLPPDVEDRLIARYQKTRFHNLRIIDAKDRFFRALRQVYDPEKKRELVGNLFIKIWQEEVKKLKLPLEKSVLLQGTIYPDTIETARTKHSDKIKTHHNRVPLIQKMIEEKKLVEPFQYLYKDEVRLLGKMLGVDDSILWRHPRPGPGNSVRILCSQYFLWPPEDETLKKALDAELEIAEFCQKQNLRAFLLPLRSTGVQGDQRTYAYTIAIETDGSPDDDWDTLINAASRIVNSHKGIINRVVLALYPKNRGLNAIGLKKAWVTKKRNAMIQKAEAIVKKYLILGGWYNFVWQFPVVLAPLSFDLLGESVILRPVESVNAMTASCRKLPWPMVESIVREIIEKIPEIRAVFYDLTSKPPATIEWE